ncbi:MAG: GGDEF domain-containing protein, partial [Planctomycetota bacterium]
MRGLVLGGVTALAAGHLLQLLSYSHPQLLMDWGVEGRTASTMIVALPALGYSLVAVGVGLLSGAARRSEKYDNASSAIPEVVHRVTNLEVIYRLLLESSTGATFVLSQTETPRKGKAGFALVAGNKSLHQLLEHGAITDRRSRTFGHDDPDGISSWIEETARQALASKAPVRSERGFSVRGQMRWYLLSCTGRGAYVAGSVEETTQSRRTSSERERSANTDPLTKLSNRGHLTKTIETEAHRTSHGLSPGFTVFFFDFDGFKGINDTLGHHVGDELLKSIAGRLRESFRGWELPRSAGRPCIARYGGDEYVIVVPGLTQHEHIERLAERFLDHL